MTCTKTHDHPDAVCVHDDCPYMMARAAKGEVVACPICGMEVLFNCWHEDLEEVTTIWMPVRGAIILLRAHVKMLQQDAASAQTALNDYLAILAELEKTS